MWKIVARCIVLAIVFHCVICGNSCDGHKTAVIGGSNRITSPKYPDENGQAADCIWDMKPSSEGPYALKLNFNRLALFYKINGKRVCSGSYNLTINNEQINCTLEIKDRDGIPSPYCLAFYNEPSCESLDQLRRCKRSRIDFPLTIRYVLDGNKNDENTYPLLGFDMAYSFIPCVPGPSISPLPDSVPLESQYGPLVTENLHNSKGLIKSPHHPNEYGFKSNYRYTISLPADGKTYLLKLTIKNLKLFMTEMGAKYCIGHLIIAADFVTCTKFVNSSTRVYYKSPHCEKHDEAKVANYLRRTSTFPVNITYQSDGGKKTNGTENNLGFFIEYKFIECKNVNTKPSGNLLRTSTKSYATTIHSVVVDNKKQGTSRIKPRIFPQEKNQSPPTKYVITTTIQEDTGAQLPTPEIIAAIVASVVAGIVFIILALYCITKRTKKTKRPKSDSRGELLVFSNNSVKITSGQTVNPEPNVKDESPAPVYSVINDDAQTGAGVYSTIASGISHTSQPETPMYSTIDSLSTDDQPHQDQSSTKQLDGEFTYCAVDTETKESFRYQKSTVFNVLYGTTERGPNC